jgi:hypothetical protein
MDKADFEKNFIDNFNKNFPEFSKYFDFNLKVFCELKTLIFEINYCLILEFYRASITLTNNLLERLLKLALIYNETGVRPKPVDQWNSIFDAPAKKYNSMTLANTIEQCKKFDLINDSEKDILFDTIRNLMRNGFSHADYSMILSDLPDNSTVFHANLNNPTEITPVSINQKVIPFLEELHIASFAKDTAKNYFFFVFTLVLLIDKRLLEKQQ